MKKTKKTFYKDSCLKISKLFDIHQYLIIRNILIIILFLTVFLENIKDKVNDISV